MNLTIKISDALLGAQYGIKTLDGDIVLIIPEGVTHGEVLRIKGKGVPFDKNRRGDILVTIKINVPKKISKDVRKKIEDLRNEGI